MNEFDDINQPKHYAYGIIECKDYLESCGIAEDYYAACIIKYITRYKRKGGVEDVRKAKRYAEYLISLLEAEVKDSEIPELLNKAAVRFPSRPDRMYSPLGEK